PWPNQVAVANVNGHLRWGPRPLAINAAVFGLGMDLRGRTHAIMDGSSVCGGGCIVGQWFDFNGTPMTGAFTLIASFSTGPSTWFETAPLLGGGLAVRRVDASSNS